MQHVHGVLSVLDTQAQAEFRVRPDIVIDGAAGLLGGQYQMYAKTAPYLGHTDQFLHKIRFFPFELSKFIYDDKQMGNRYRGLLVFIEPGIQIDGIDIMGREKPLPAMILTLDADHGSGNLIA